MSTSARNNSDDQDIELKHNSLRLRTSAYGASLRGCWQETPAGFRRDIVTSYQGRANKVGGQGDVLIPFPGRINEGRYRFNEVAHQLECNDKEGPNAIHGFLRAEPWSIMDRSESHIQFAVDLDATAHKGYPFSLHTQVSYSLADGGFTCSYRICNTGESAAPVAAGFHPYFSVGSEPIDDWTLQLPFAATLEFENLIPTGRILPVEGTEFDFRSPRKIGSTTLNTCFVNPQRDEDDNGARISIRLTGPDGRAIVIWADKSLDYFVLYSGDPLPEPHRRRSLAIEPMTSGSDGFNHQEWGLISLEPGAATSGTWGVAV